jgi:hypothetical protein
VVDSCELPPPPAYSSLTFDPDPPPHSAVAAISVVTSRPMPPSSRSISNSRTPSPGVHGASYPQPPASQVSLDLQARRRVSRQQSTNGDHTSDRHGHRVRECFHDFIMYTTFCLFCNIPFTCIIFFLLCEFTHSTVAFSWFFHIHVVS